MMADGGREEKGRKKKRDHLIPEKIPETGGVGNHKWTTQKSKAT
jgi:hypothetical protein